MLGTSRDWRQAYLAREAISKDQRVMRICNRRVLGWSLFAILLAGVALGLYVVLPPEPRWALRGRSVPAGITPDGSAWITLGHAIGMRDIDAFVAPETRTGPVQYRDVATGRELASVLGDRGPRWQVGFSRDRKLLAAIAPLPDDAGRAELRWLDVSAGHERRTVLERPAASWRPRISPSGALLLLEDWNDPAHGVYVYEPASLRLLAKATDPRGSRLPWAWTPDGNALYLCTTDANRNAALRRIATDGETTVLLEGAGKWLAMSPDGKTLLTWPPEPDDRVLVWDLPAGTRRGTIALNTPVVNWRDPVFAPDGRTLAITMGTDAGDKLGLWDVDTAKWLAEVPFARDLTKPYFLTSSVLIVNEDYRRLAGYRLRPFAKLWQRDGKRLQVVDSSVDRERLIVLACEDSRVDISHRLVESSARGGDRLQLIDSHTGMATLESTLDPEAAHTWFMGKNHLVVVTIHDSAGQRGVIRAFIEDRLHPLLTRNRPSDFDVSTTVRIFDMAIGTERCSISLRNAVIAGQALSPDGQTLILYQPAHGADTGAILCYDVPPRRPWRLILAIPTALGVLALLVRTGWRRWRRRVVTTAPQGAPSCP
jgi:WD40 repeat protein